MSKCDDCINNSNDSKLNRYCDTCIHDKPMIDNYRQKLKEFWLTYYPEFEGSKAIGGCYPTKKEAEGMVGIEGSIILFREVIEDE